MYSLSDLVEGSVRINSRELPYPTADYEVCEITVYRKKRGKQVIVANIDGVPIEKETLAIYDFIRSPKIWDASGDLAINLTKAIEAYADRAINNATDSYY